MNFNMNIPGLKVVEITKTEELDDRIALYVQMPKCTYLCPACKQETNCGKRFSEKSPFLDRYQRYSKEW